MYVPQVHSIPKTSEINFLAPGVTQKLECLFHRVHAEYPFYRQIFEKEGLSLNSDPICILSHFPVLDRVGYLELQKDIFSRLKGGHFLTEHTSGTTGSKRLRFVTQQDEAAEEELCLRFFKQCGLKPSDRVLAIDIDSPEIYLFYSRALLRMGIQNFSYVNFTTDQALEPLFTFRPTVIISVPSVLRRCSSALKRISHSAEGHLRVVIYIAENMSSVLRSVLSEELGLEIFSFYGSTEIGSMAGECQEHQGIHLFNDAVIPTLIDPVDDGDALTGEVAWTTLHFVDQPLIKYLTGDVVSIAKKRCSCGSIYPLMLRVSRVDDAFAVYGQKFKYYDFEQAIVKEIGSIDFFRIVVSTEDKCDKVVFEVSASLIEKKEPILKAIRTIGDFNYFMEMGFLVSDVQLYSADETIKRKTMRVVDHRDRT